MWLSAITGDRKQVFFKSWPNITWVADRLVYGVFVRTLTAWEPQHWPKVPLSMVFCKHFPDETWKACQGKPTDGTKTMRMVGLQGHQQNQLATYHESPVTLHNCKVKPAHQSQELEVLMKSNNRIEGIESSPRKFDVDIKNITQNEITLDCLATKNNYDRISGTAKVTWISETTKYPAALLSKM